jgi:L-lactate dehydrogenase complex protein LldE
MRVRPFVPCFIDTFCPEGGIAASEVPERFGHEICGQLTADDDLHADRAATEAPLVRSFSGFDYMVAPEGAVSSTCAIISTRSSRPRR